MNLAFGNSTLIPTLVPEHQLLNESYYNTVTRAGKSPTQQVFPFSKVHKTSCRIRPTCHIHLHSLRRNVDHSYSTHCSAWNDPENHYEGGQSHERATQERCPGQTGPRESAVQAWAGVGMTCLHLWAGGEAGCTQRQQGRCHLTEEMQEGRGSLIMLQESSPLWFPYLHDLKCSFLRHLVKGAASLARPRLGTWDTANLSSLPRLCLTKGTEVVTPSAALSN